MKCLLLPLLCLGMVWPLWAAGYPIGVSVHGGYDYPVVQQDVGGGPMWSVGVRGNIWRFVHGQLVVRGTSQGNKDQDLEFGNQTETLTLKGGTLNGFGLNLLLAAKEPSSVWPYFIFGVSSNSFKPGDSFRKSENLNGMSGGIGMGINLYQRTVFFDLNTSLLVMPFHNNKASRKDWQTLLGLQYFIPITK